jgi:uncharacterized membrane protein
VTAFDRAIGRLLIALTYIGTGLLVVGVLLMVANGIPPSSGGPNLDLASLPGDIVALRPAGFLWLGLLAVLATPITRVIAAAVGFWLAGDRQMVVVAVATLVVIGVAIGSAVAFG